MKATITKINLSDETSIVSEVEYTRLYELLDRMGRVAKQEDVTIDVTLED